MVDHKPCPYCEEPIRAKARKCRHCGEFLDEEAWLATGGKGRVRRLTAAERIRRISARERRAGSLWLIVGILQCLTAVLAVSGVWNIVRGTKARKRSRQIAERDATVPLRLERARPLVVTVFVNILFGAGLGVPIVILDALTRREILAMRRLFRRNAEDGATGSPHGKKTPEPVVLNVPYELAYGVLRDTMTDAGGTICMDDIEGGGLEATWSYGSNVFGLHVSGFIRRTADGCIQVDLRGGFKDMPDTFGHARHKAFAIRDAYVEQFDDMDSAEVPVARPGV